MDKLVLKSPAKLNLYLDVLNRRPDGYHNIETIFEKIALFDTITIRPHKKGIRVTSNKASLPTDRENLAYKALELVFKQVNFKGGSWLHIEKNIPIAGGLGGGSSNAATALFGANRFFKLGLSEEELIKLGSLLGADVPFFLHNAPFAIGRARGDEIRPLYNDINIWHIIVSFDFGVSTKEVYAKMGHSLKLTPAADGVKITLLFIRKNDIENLAASIYNRLEEAVMGKYDSVRAAKAALLKEGAYGAVLSGSGPTVFGMVKTREEALEIKKRIQHKVGSVSEILVVETMKGA